MSDFLEKLKGLVEFAKLILPLMGLGGSGAALFQTSLGGKRMFEAFSSNNHINSTGTRQIDSEKLLDWGKEIILKPSEQIVDAEPLTLIGWLVGFLVAAFGLIYHLLSREEMDGETRVSRLYKSNHSYVTILIYFVLLLTIVISNNLKLTFIALILFAIFFAVHMYLYFRDIKSGHKAEKAAWILSWIHLLVIVMLLPNVYGKKFFSPDVHALAAFTEKGERVAVIKEQSIMVFFSMPEGEGDYAVAHLLPETPNGTRTFNVVRQHIPEPTSRSLIYIPVISLRDLLQIQHKPVPAEIKVDPAEIAKSVRQDLEKQPEAPIDRGYSVPM